MKEITKAKFINTWASEWDERTGWKVSEKYHKQFSEQLEYLINQEAEKRIAERMPSEEEIEKHFITPHYHYEKGHYYKVRKDRIFGANWLRSRLTKPGAETSQKTEGGGE